MASYDFGYHFSSPRTISDAFTSKHTKYPRGLQNLDLHLHLENFRKSFASPLAQLNLKMPSLTAAQPSVEYSHFSKHWFSLPIGWSLPSMPAHYEDILQEPLFLLQYKKQTLKKKNVSLNFEYTLCGSELKRAGKWTMKSIFCFKRFSRIFSPSF